MLDKYTTNVSKVYPSIKKRTNKDGKTQICLTYSYDRRRRCELGLGIYIEPAAWNSNRLEVRRSHQQSDEFNEFLQEGKQKIEKIVRELKREEEDPIPALVKSVFLGHSTAQAIKLDVFAALNDFVEKRSFQVSINSIKDYKSLKKHLRGYEVYSKRPLTFKSFDFRFYEDFTYYLEHVMRKPNGEIGLAKNSVGKQIKNIKLFLKHCMKYKHCGFINLDDFKVKYVQKTHVYLNETDLEKIEQLDLTEDSKLDKIRDLLLVGCETGLRFSDFHKLSPEVIREKRLELVTRKTMKRVFIPISDRLRRIISKYDQNFPQGIWQNIFNVEVKRICQLAGIEEMFHSIEQKANRKEEKWTPKYQLVSSHICRRSFATNAYKRGIPMVIIRAITGHSSDNALLRYVQIEQEEMVEMAWGEYFG